MIRLGIAGGSIPKRVAHAFPAEGSHLERYVAVFDAVEINSTFYRPHRPATFSRWAASVPPGFCFALKVPKHISHTLRLVQARPAFETFLAETAALGSKRCNAFSPTPGRATQAPSRLSRDMGVGLPRRWKDSSSSIG